jgi:hypothetical protein
MREISAKVAVTWISNLPTLAGARATRALMFTRYGSQDRFYQSVLCQGQFCGPTPVSNVMYQVRQAYIGPNSDRGDSRRVQDILPAMASTAAMTGPQCRNQKLPRAPPPYKSRTTSTHLSSYSTPQWCSRTRSRVNSCRIPPGRRSSSAGIMEPYLARPP